MSRIIILTKNYLKLIFRAKSVLIITVVGALVVMAALTNVFHTLLDQAETEEDFTIGYEMDEDSRYALLEESIKSGFEDEGMTVIEYSDADPDALIRDEDAVLGHEGRHGLDFLVSLVEGYLHGDDDLAVVGLVEGR